MIRTRLLMVTALLGLTGCGFSGEDPRQPDGCSMVPDFDFTNCCEAHDAIYWEGGTEAARLEADQAFEKCVINKGHSVIGPLYYTGVRVFGTPHLPTSWRWGFGKDYPTGYEGDVK